MLLAERSYLPAPRTFFTSLMFLVKTCLLHGGRLFVKFLRHYFIVFPSHILLTVGPQGGVQWQKRPKMAR